MKRILLTVLLLCAFAAPAMGQYFSLWADEGQSASEFWTDDPYKAFTIYVFLDPGSDGAFGAEYKLTIPAGHFSTGTTQAQFISTAIIGTPCGAPGISAGFTECQNDTVWLFAVSFMASNTDPGKYRIVENDQSGFCGIATCEEPGRPLVEVDPYNTFCYNTTDDSRAEASWGVIKKQY